MRTLILPLALLAVAACAPVDPATQTAQNTASEGELSAALAGYSRTGTTSCAHQPELRGSKIINGTAIIYDTVNRSRKLVNRLRGPGSCPQLRDGRALISNTPTEQLCSGETLNIVEVPGPAQYGFCQLGEFEVWERPQQGG